MNVRTPDPVLEATRCGGAAGTSERRPLSPAEIEPA